MKYCKPFPYHIISISCLFKPVVDVDTNGCTMFHKMIKIVCEYCKVTPAELKSATRKIQIVEARHLLIYFLYNYAKNTTTLSLGRYFNRDHSTIINSIKVVKNFNEVDPEFNIRFKHLKKEILQAIVN